MAAADKAFAACAYINVSLDANGHRQTASTLPVFQVDFEYLPVAFEEPLHVLFPGSVA